MYLYVERVGYFRMGMPQVANDGFAEQKVINASSCDCELQKKFLVNFKVNCGTEDSLEYLYEGNVYEDETGLKLPKEYISLYNSKDPNLSLLDLVLEKAPNWSIGYVDPVVNMGTNDEGIPAIIKRSFEVDSQDIYSFLTQSAASAYQCVFLFDIMNREINVYSIENLGKDSGVFLSFRNVVQSININETTEDSVYTRFNVAGADDLNIDAINFGNSYIEDLSYFLREKYMDASLIEKYKNWQAFIGQQRETYIDVTKQYNTVMNEQSEIMYRVPNDGCKTDWTTFTTEELEGLIDTYTDMAQALKDNWYIDGEWTNDAAYRDYRCYTETIVPNIKITLENREGQTTDPTYKDKELINAWETDWDLFGLQELRAKLESYQENAQSLVDYAKPWNELTDEEKREKTEQSYTIYHDRWQEYRNLIDECSVAVEERQKEYDSYTSKLDALQEQRLQITASVDKETFGFTEDEIKLLSQFYNDSDYVNENILITSLDDVESTLGVQKQLLEAANEELSIENHPQLSFSTSIDNLFAIPEFKQWREDFDIGNFLYLSTSDDDRYFVKLRLTDITWNPCVPESDLQIGFSNMITSKSRRNDFTTILDNAITSAKNQISGKIKSTLDSSAVTVSDALLQAIINSGSMNSAISNGVFDTIQANLGVFGNIVAGSVNANEILANSGMFETVIADDGTFIDALAVEINANRINAGVLSVERLIIRGTTGPDGKPIESLMYALNNEGVLEESKIDKSEYDYYMFNGRNIAANSISADRIAANSISAKQLAADAITSFNNVTKLNLATGVLQVGISTASPNGALYFDGTNLYINGNGTFSGTITANNGKIGPWIINSTSIYKGSSAWGTAGAGNIYLGNDGFSLGDKLKYDNVGNLSITGNITASTGTIAGWTINPTVILKTDTSGDGKNKTVTINSNFYTAANNNPYNPVFGVQWDNTWYFYVRSNGELYARNANIQGKITATSGSFTGTVNAQGGTFSGNINCTGTIAGAKLSGATGTFTGTVTATSGTFDNVTIRSGKIGGWNITDPEINNGQWGNGTGTGMGQAYGPEKMAFWAGDGKFQVLYNGKIIATNADIKGSVNATTLKAQNAYQLWANSESTATNVIEANTTSFNGNTTGRNVYMGLRNNGVAPYCYINFDTWNNVGTVDLYGSTQVGIYTPSMQIGTPGDTSFYAALSGRLEVSGWVWTPEVTCDHLKIVGDGTNGIIEIQTPGSNGQILLSTPVLNITGGEINIGNISPTSPSGPDTHFYGPLHDHYGHTHTTENMRQCCYITAYEGSTNVRFARYVSSSKRYKNRITSEFDSTCNPSALYDLPVVTYHYNEGYCSDDTQGKKLHIGLIAEDVEKYYPVACGYENGEPENWNVMELVPGMLKLIQEQHQAIKNLQSELQALKNKMN